MFEYETISPNEIKEGDVVEVGYDFSSVCNKVLITNTNVLSENILFKGIWLDSEVEGKNYIVTNNQIIFSIIERNVNIQEKIKELDKIRRNNIEKFGKWDDFYV